jgi:hypothetical protein
MKQPTLINTELIAAVRERFQLDWNGVHGAPHWARVRVNGLMLAPLTNARTDVMSYLHFFMTVVAKTITKIQTMVYVLLSLLQA